MDNIQRIDNIIEELKNKIGFADQEEKRETALTAKQLEIKSFLDERRIKYLIHFTDAENIQSIRENGILSVEQLKNTGLSFKANDENRYEAALDYISLSVSGINQYL